MPPAVLTFIGGAAVLKTFLISVVVSFVLTVLSRALTPSPKTPTQRPRGWQERLGQRLDPVAPRDVIYGEVRVSGPVIYREVTDEGKLLHMVIALCTGEVTDIPVVFLDDYPIYADMLDTGGTVTVQGSKYYNKFLVRSYLGTSTQNADVVLVGDSAGQWTSDHRLRGITYLYVRLFYNTEVFPSVPAISAYVKGRKVKEIRTAGSPVKFSVNPALILRDYTTTPIVDMGVGFSEIDIDDVFLEASANVCDEFVDVNPVTFSVDHIDSSDSGVYITGQDKAFLLQTGDRVTIGGQTRYVVFYKPFLSDVQEHHAIRLATSYENAVEGTFVAPPAGATEVVKTAEPRYACNGIIDSSRAPGNNIEDLLSSMGGKAVYSGGKWRISPAVYVSPVLEFDESDIIDSIDVQTKHSLRERFNAVKGQYTSPINLGVPAEYPRVLNSTYQTEDNDTRIFADWDLLFTNRPHTGQRLGKIKLEQHRQSIVFKSSFKLSALQVQPGDTILLSLSRMGWIRKIFEVIEWEFVGGDDDNGAPIFTVDMTLQETASGVYDWSMGEETIVDLAPNTNLGQVLTSVTGITANFSSVIGEDGTAYTSMRVCWDEHLNPSIVSYDVEYKKTTDTDWIFWTSVAALCTSIEPLEAATLYDVRVRAVDVLDRRGPYNTRMNNQVIGDRDPPGDVTSSTLQATPGGYIAMWENPTDLDLDVVEVWEREIP